MRNQVNKVIAAETPSHRAECTTPSSWHPCMSLCVPRSNNKVLWFPLCCETLCLSALTVRSLSNSVHTHFETGLQVLYINLDCRYPRSGCRALDTAVSTSQTEWTTAYLAIRGLTPSASFVLLGMGAAGATPRYHACCQSLPQRVAIATAPLFIPDPGTDWRIATYLYNIHVAATLR